MDRTISALQFHYKFVSKIGFLHIFSLFVTQRRNYYENIDLIVGLAMEVQQNFSKFFGKDSFKLRNCQS